MQPDAYPKYLLIYITEKRANVAHQTYFSLCFSRLALSLPDKKKVIWKRKALHNVPSY